VFAIFPLALLSSSVALDIAGVILQRTTFEAAARFALGAGVIAGVVAAIPGIVDLWLYPRAARGTPIRHGVLNGITLALMLVSWRLRPAPTSDAGGTVAANVASTPPYTIALSVAAMILAVVAWRLGMRLTPAPSPRTLNQ
jgi:uncharacterized membrane protein